MDLGTICFLPRLVNLAQNLFEAELTHDGENDHHEVEDVPANGEEVATQRHDLDQALGSEDDDEGQVDVVQDLLHLRQLLVRLHHHGDHVEEDQHHDDDVERLLPNQVEEEALQSVLRSKNVWLADKPPFSVSVFAKPRQVVYKPVIKDANQSAVQQTFTGFAATKADAEFFAT